MNETIPVRFRYLAFGLHCLGALSPALILVIFALIVLSDTAKIYLIPAPALQYLIRHDLWILAGVKIGSPIMNAVLWRVTYLQHPFVDRAGRDVINYALNNSAIDIVCCLSAIFLFYTICGTSVFDSLVFLLCDFIVLFFAIAYFTHAFISGILALIGYRFYNPLIYPLF